MRKISTSFLKHVLTLIALFGFCLLGAQNPTISIQGTLKAANGTSVGDGDYDVTFRLYDAATGGNEKWSEDATVTVTGGIYSHYLGSVDPLITSAFNDKLYLAVEVNSKELTPRSELSYSPYAFSVYSVQCSGAVGDIKYSILNPTQFAAENGDCWVPMDGSSLAGSRLKQITGMNSLPDASGVFLRATEFSGGADRDPDRGPNASPGALQGDTFKSHNHGVTDNGHSHVFSDIFNGSEQTYTQAQNDVVGSDQTTSTNHNTQSSNSNISINSTGGDETRPKNMNFWIYIRIN
ncbi:MAG: hypothetical protein R3A50_09235 [Saprospiraceae bacterium]|nr:hypothetical protein [Saprospiraceae bacterium]MCB9344597.1 hypothetical protein [Lewinellaceae bacterium]